MTFFNKKEEVFELKLTRVGREKLSVGQFIPTHYDFLDDNDKIEKGMGNTFGDPDNPLLLSVRSGARMSMPGMMETVLNVGLTSKTIPGLIKKTDNTRFVYDAYRRLVMMYSDVVMEKAAGLDPEEGQGIRHQLESILNNYTHSGVTNKHHMSPLQIAHPHPN